VRAGKLGKKTGEGFYKWIDGKPQKGKHDWTKAELEKLGRELVDPIITEAQKSLDEGVVASADLVDAGMIFGTGFAPFRGGPLYFKAGEDMLSAKAAA
ncbi:MAG: 3-hydroxyacyl-CoA dehydrogenase, partial [Deltaproteobacteria bacterium]